MQFRLEVQKGVFFSSEVSLTVKFSSHGESQEPVGLLWRDYIITVMTTFHFNFLTVMNLNIHIWHLNSMESLINDFSQKGGCLNN